MTHCVERNKDESESRRLVGGGPRQKSGKASSSAEIKEVWRQRSPDTMLRSIRQLSSLSLIYSLFLMQCFHQWCNMAAQPSAIASTFQPGEKKRGKSDIVSFFKDIFPK